MYVFGGNILVLLCSEKESLLKNIGITVEYNSMLFHYKWMLFDVIMCAFN